MSRGLGDVYKRQIQLYLEMAKGNYEVSFVIALVLVVIVLGLNMLAKWISRRFDVNKGDN